MAELEALLADATILRADEQRIGWSYHAWTSALTDFGFSGEAVGTLEALEDRWAVDHGILRQAVVDVADGDPIRLLVASMVWGFGSLAYGPTRTTKMLRTHDLAAKLSSVVAAAQESPEAGFSSLFSDGKPIIQGLSIAMGTKLLYFAARSVDNPPNPLPLVLDRNLHSALIVIDDPAFSHPIPNPEGRMSGTDYGRLMRELAEVGATTGLRPDDVEYALFQHSTWRRRRLRLEHLASED